VVGDGGQSIAQSLNVPVTTGNSYTVATAIHAVRNAAHQAGIRLDQTNVAVVGASGAIGSVCARLLAPDAGGLILVGRSKAGLQAVAHKVIASGASDVQIGTDPDLIRKARIVITVTSATSPVIDSQHLGPASIVCDVARPRDTALHVSQERPDVLVLEGGAVSVPGQVNFGFDFGFPPGMAYACMAETMALALEGRYESFSLGKHVRLDGVNIIDEIAARHGFKVAGLRSPQEVVAESRLSGALEALDCAQAEGLHRQRNRGVLPSLVKSVEVQSL
jgi:predicted amino acid dehydrogenase